jgi:multidrug efflux pump subunit AcrB
MVPTTERNIEAGQFADKWREEFGEVAGVESISFKYNIGPSAGEPINIQLSHYDTKVLEAASSTLAKALLDYNGVIDIEDGFADGKTQLNFNLKPGARALGLNEQDLARQIRASFFGVQAVRQQRGRNEVRTYVRLPESERNSKQALESLLLRTQAGGEIPFSAAATVSEGRAETEIKRSEGRRVVNITADIQEGANANKILASVKDKIMPALVDDHPGLKFSLEGEQREQADALGSLRTGAMMSLLGIFALLAIPFRSYVQPLIIMSAIPFGLVGAILGHVVMQVELSLMSIMGIVALTGIVVNDSLVLIVFIN